MTMFVGALSIDLKRINRGRADLICCFCKVENENELRRREELFHPKFQRYFVPLLFHPINKVAVIGITVLMTALGCMSQFNFNLGLS